MGNLKKLVFRCYTYHRSEYLLRFCSYLAQYPHDKLEYVNNWDSTTSLYHKSTGKLLVTFRNENMVCFYFSSSRTHHRLPTMLFQMRCFPCRTTIKRWMVREECCCLWTARRPDSQMARNDSSFGRHRRSWLHLRRWSNHQRMTSISATTATQSLSDYIRWRYIDEVLGL